jgi:hypothetical protein
MQLCDCLGKNKIKFEIFESWSQGWQETIFQGDKYNYMKPHGNGKNDSYFQEAY